MAKLPDSEIKKIPGALKRHNGDRKEAAKELGLSLTGLESRIKIARTRFGKDFVPNYADNLKRPDRVDPQDITDAVWAMEIEKGTISAAARRLGIPIPTLRTRLEIAERQPKLMNGQSEARDPIIRDLPPKGQVNRFVVTSLQNNTYLHDATFETLKSIAEHEDAELMVGTFSYMHRAEGSEKRGSRAKHDRTKWWTPEIEPYICDDLVQLAPGLMWNGHTQNWPTAVDPLSGYENYNGRASGIFPHAKLQMKSIPTIQSDATKLQYTTGTCGLLNYIQRKAGQKAEFDHVFGGLLIEVNSEGDWWVHQLVSNHKGEIRWFEWAYTPDGKKKKHDGVEAFQPGDIHVDQLEEWHADLLWGKGGKGGLVDLLKPRYQYMHDLMDFQRRSHHNLKDPHKMFELHARGLESVEDEGHGVGDFLQRADRPWSIIRVVPANHNEHTNRWLKEGNWKNDPVNALIYLELNTAWLRAIKAGRKDFNPTQHLVEMVNPCPRVEWLDRSQPSIILKRLGGGIEMGLHGDNGPNGSRGSLRNLSKIGRRICIGHSHSAGIFNGAWQAGVTGRLDMDYAIGSPSSWTHSHIIVHKTGKRQMVTVWKGKYRA